MPRPKPEHPPRDILNRTIRVGDLVATSSSRFGVVIARVRSEPKWFETKYGGYDQRVPVTGLVGREGNFTVMQYSTVCILTDHIEEDIKLADALKRLDKE